MALGCFDSYKIDYINEIPRVSLWRRITGKARQLPQPHSVFPYRVSCPFVRPGGVKNHSVVHPRGWDFGEARDQRESPSGVGETTTKEASWLASELLPIQTV